MSENNLLVTISGPPASGTSSLASKLSNKIDAEVISGGDIFRNMADERDIKPYELSEIAENNESIDKEVDDRLKQIIDEHFEKEKDQRLIIDSRLAGWHADGRADLSIWLKAPIDTRFSRLESRNETRQELRRREESDAKRYLDYYNIDIDNMSVYDIVIDTETFSEKNTVKVAETSLNSQI